MKTFLLSLGFLMTTALASAGSEVINIEMAQSESFILLSPCTVTVKKMCDGIGREVSHSSTSEIGNCGDAYTAANEGWPGACLNEIILHELKKEED